MSYKERVITWWATLPNKNLQYLVLGGSLVVGTIVFFSFLVIVGIILHLMHILALVILLIVLATVSWSVGFILMDAG